MCFKISFSKWWFLHAYTTKKWLIDEIEHILPKKWQDTNYQGWDRKDADSYLEHIGNKMLLEKKLNIECGNGYFGQKKEKYADSSFCEAKSLSKYPKNDWLKVDIKKRNE